MIDGGTNPAGGRDIRWIGDFFKITLQSNGHGKEEIVDNKKDGSHSDMLYKGITQENQNQSGIFYKESVPLPDVGNKPSNDRPQPQANDLSD